MAEKLPRILSFPGSKQNSISVLRALKLARDCLETLAAGEMPKAPDAIDVALDDLELMIKSVE